MNLFYNEPMITRTDDLNRIVRLDGSARRIVCLVPSITETLFALGAGGRLVGITDYCIHPEEEVALKARVGGTKDFKLEKVLALDPDLVVANAEENAHPQIEKLEKEGLTVFVTFPRTVDGCVKMITDLGALTGTETAARTIAADIESARSRASKRARTPLPRVLCPIWKEPYVTINRDTFVDNVIRSSGGMNVFEDSRTRYPRFELEEAARKRPDVILLPTEPYHFTESDKKEFLALGRDVPAVRDRRIHIIEGELLSWYGPRAARALREISALLRESKQEPGVKKQKSE